MSKPFVFLQALAEQKEFPWQEDPVRSRVDVVDQYALSRKLLADRNALILTMHQDQIHLQRQSALIEDYVSTGGSLVIQGHVTLPFLKLLSVFEPLPKAGPDQLRLYLAQPDHPLFRNLDPTTLAVRKGVAGFYARGQSKPPADAQILSYIDDGRCPVDWICPAGKGLVFMHPGNDLWTTFADADANLDMTLRLLDWLEDPRYPND